MTTPTLLQIDLQNLFFEAKNKGQRIDFEKIWNHFNSRETEFLTNAFIYTVHGSGFDSSKFESKMTNVGYKIVVKNSLKILKNNQVYYKQTNHDVGLTIDCIERLDQFKKWILMSGDGDFVELCKFLKRNNKQIEIWSFKECYNSALEPYSDKIYFIDDNFFYKKPTIRVFGFNRGFNEKY